MQKYFPPLVLLLIISYGLYNAALKTVKSSTPAAHSTYSQHIKTHTSMHADEELSVLHSDVYLQQYIADVINHGSSQLHFKKDEVMEAGFAPKEDASHIACYVMTLSGKHCKSPYPPESIGLFTSICGGCHGNDGKGLGGTYPDLTREPLLGIAQREAFLRSKVAQ